MSPSLQRGCSRAFLFLAVAFPSLAWLLPGCFLARPLDTALWTFLCAAAVAMLPGRRGAIIVAWWLLLSLPFTLSWLGMVVLTGQGPSSMAFVSAFTAGPAEIKSSIRLALLSPAFCVLSVLSIAACLWAIRLAHGYPKDRDPAVLKLGFLIFMFSAGCVQVDSYPSVVRLAGPEARTSVPGLALASLLKQGAAMAMNPATFGHLNPDTIERDAAMTPKTYLQSDGLAVLVIGESLRADALLGESRGPWSKAMQQRLAAGLGVRVPDACSYANGTVASVPRLMTAAEVWDEKGAMSRPTILAEAKAAGARTAYISNHESMVVREKGHDFYMNVASQEFPQYDEVVIEAFGGFLKRFGKGPKAAVLHLYGQHFVYADRYPHSLFPAVPKGVSSDAEEELHYQRAAEYGVKVLLDLAAVLDASGEPAYAVFTSDHGEDLPSDVTGRRRHAGPISGRNNTTVPVLILWNKAFVRSGRLEGVRALLDAKKLIAHRDVVLAWQVLGGKKILFEVTQEPVTLGSRAGVEKTGGISCASLVP